MKFLGDRQGFLWQAVIVFLILLDGILLFLALISNLKIVSLEYVAVIDLLVSIILLILFILAILKTKNIKYYLRKNWALVFSFIPLYFIVFITGLNEYIFLVKLFNIIKIISLYLYAQQFARGVIKYQEKTRLVYALATFLLVLFICSFIFFTAENGVNPHVSNYEDSLWFILQTITTVGYGDIVPVTGIGRVMGVISMLSALILTSIITSVATFSLIEKFRKSTDELTQKTKESVENLDKKLDNINHHLKETDKSEDINDIKNDLQDLKSEIDDIKDLIRKKN